MRIATYKNEESLTMIVNRLYLIEGPGSRSRRAEAERRSLRATHTLRT